MSGAANGFAGSQGGVNVAYTTFSFVTPTRPEPGRGTPDEEAIRARLRAAGSIVGRGFFNEFDTEGGASAPHETIQFLVRADHGGTPGAGAPYALQVCSKYRPRLEETDAELRRRVAEIAQVSTLVGAVRVPQYTSAAMYAYAFKPAMTRGSGRVQKNAIIIPMRKTKEWWDKPELERQTYFYPHADPTGARVKGHARAAEAGIATIYRKLYYNPDGPAREAEWDFVTYFECADEQLTTFDEICRALRDIRHNPEWRYVIEGPEWRGRRVMKW